MIKRSKSFIAVPPGETIKEMMQEKGIDTERFKIVMSMTDKQLLDLLNGDVELTDEIADKLASIFGMENGSFWTSLEEIYRGTLAKVKAENGSLNQDDIDPDTLTEYEKMYYDLLPAIKNPMEFDLYTYLSMSSSYIGNMTDEFMHNVAKINGLFLKYFVNVILHYYHCRRMDCHLDSPNDSDLFKDMIKFVEQFAVVTDPDNVFDDVTVNPFTTDQMILSEEVYGKFPHLRKSDSFHPVLTDLVYHMNKRSLLEEIVNPTMCAERFGSIMGYGYPKLIFWILDTKNIFFKQLDDEEKISIGRYIAMNIILDKGAHSILTETLTFMLFDNMNVDLERGVDLLRQWVAIGIRRYFTLSKRRHIQCSREVYLRKEILEYAVGQSVEELLSEKTGCSDIMGYVGRSQL